MTRNEIIGEKRAELLNCIDYTLFGLYPEILKYYVATNGNLKNDVDEAHYDCGQVFVSFEDGNYLAIDVIESSFEVETFEGGYHGSPYGSALLSPDEYFAEFPDRVKHYAWDNLTRGILDRYFDI